MNDNISRWEMKVPIKDNLKQKKPFGTQLQSNLVSATTLSYFGRMD